MAYEIVWTENAAQDLKTIIEYLRDEWSVDVAERFIEEKILTVPFPAFPASPLFLGSGLTWL